MCVCGLGVCVGVNVCGLCGVGGVDVDMCVCVGVIWG